MTKKSAKIELSEAEKALQAVSKGAKKVVGFQRRTGGTKDATAIYKEGLVVVREGPDGSVAITLNIGVSQEQAKAVGDFLNAITQPLPVQEEKDDEDAS